MLVALELYLDNQKTQRDECSCFRVLFHVDIYHPCCPVCSVANYSVPYSVPPRQNAPLNYALFAGNARGQAQNVCLEPQEGGNRQNAYLVPQAEDDSTGSYLEPLAGNGIGAYLVPHNTLQRGGECIGQKFMGKTSC